MSFSRGRRKGSGDPHGWNSFDNYIAFHHRRLGEFREYLVVTDSLTYEFEKDGSFVIRGRVSCEHGLFLEVEKKLEVSDARRVRTARYSYYAGVQGRADRPIFRYDNFHVYETEGHLDAHHRHRFDHHTWEEIEPPDWIGRDRWPHLDEVIKELRLWWEHVGKELWLGELDE